MLSRFPSFLLAAALGLVAMGCAKTEQKLGRGISNMTEFARFGEIQRSTEQAAIFSVPGEGGYATGFVRGFNKSLARTGVGIYEVLTCPFPPYGPVLTDYLPPGPVYPDSHIPGLWSLGATSPDTFYGFSGGYIAPMIPGSRFFVFSN
jgi:putative exosortase-associated protein (TIGR04073 family)